MFSLTIYNYNKYNFCGKSNLVPELKELSLNPHLSPTDAKNEELNSNQSTYSNQQVTFKSNGLLVLIIVDYIGIGWI